jgi:hypothetical protein
MSFDLYKAGQAMKIKDVDTVVRSEVLRLIDAIVSKGERGKAVMYEKMTRQHSDTGQDLPGSEGGPMNFLDQIVVYEAESISCLTNSGCGMQNVLNHTDRRMSEEPPQEFTLNIRGS